jgi:hypothetical protein
MHQPVMKRRLDCSESRQAQQVANLLVQALRCGVGRRLRFTAYMFEAHDLTALVEEGRSLR